MNLSKKHIVLIFISLLGLAIAIVVGMVLFNPARNAFGFAASRAKYEAIVAEVGEQLRLEDTLVAFRLRDLEDPKTLEPVAGNDRAARGAGAGSVWAMRHAGVLQVWIETEDHGHAGESGYVFDGHGGPVRWDDRYGERWQVGQQLDDHWWAISNRMD